MMDEFTKMAIKPKLCGIWIFCGFYVISPIDDKEAIVEVSDL